MDIPYEYYDDNTNDDEKLLCGQIYMNIIKNSISFRCNICLYHVDEIHEYKNHLMKIHFKNNDNKIQKTVYTEKVEPTNVYYESSPQIIRESEKPSHNSPPSELSLTFDETTSIDPLDYVEIINKCNSSTTKQKKKKSKSNLLKPTQQDTKIIKEEIINMKCEYCYKRFDDVNRFSHHLRVNTMKLIVSPTYYKCKYCHQTFPSMCTLRKHLLIIHDVTREPNLYASTVKTDRSIICDICKKTFMSYLGIRRHMNLHSSEDMRSCKICGKLFADQHYLKVHMRVHTGEKPYQCQVCGKCFITASKLAFHMRRHNNDLNRHKCEICGNGYRFPKLLLYHMRTHTGEKPHSCDICDKKFTQPKLLKCHKRLHTGEKPYKCRYCDSHFSQMSNRTLHQKQHHDNVD